MADEDSVEENSNWAFQEEEEEGFYKLESPSLDYLAYDAVRLRFLEYPKVTAAEQRSLASFSPTVRPVLLFFVLSS